MWCTQCQQDVPAVICATRGGRAANHGQLVCPCCQHELAAGGQSRPADSGIPLVDYDQHSSADVVPSPHLLVEDESRQKLNRLGRQLRAVCRDPLPSPGAYLPHLPTSPQPLPTETWPGYRWPSRPRRGWFLSGLLVLGMGAFFLGLGLLVWSTAFALAPVWRWGITTTLAAEGLLILGLTWMAARLWYNSRQLNRQLTGVDRRLQEVQQQARAVAGSRLYSHHLGQPVRPHSWTANLQGQMTVGATQVGAGLQSGAHVTSMPTGCSR